VNYIDKFKLITLYSDLILYLHFFFFPFFRDYEDSGSIYTLTDSGGECGIPYETYFPMPTSGKDKPWYSIEQGSVHFTVISTEHNWTQNSEQVRLIKRFVFFMFIS
jgi:hypothetical protein